ncbi:MAG: hypothetical protein V4590_03750 [Bacteroidota bacterium]
MDSEQKDVNIKDVVGFINSQIVLLKKHRLKLIVSLVLGVIVGVLIPLIIKPKYEATFSFVLNESEKVGGSLASLVGQLGLSSGGASITDEKVVFLIQSKQIIGSTLLSKMVDRDEILANFYIEQFKLGNSWKNDTTLHDFKGFTGNPIANLTYAEHKALNQIINEIILSQSLIVQSTKKTTLVGSAQGGIILISYKSKSEVFAKNFLDKITEELSKFYVSKSIQRQEMNFRIITNRSDSLRFLIKEKENNLIAFKNAPLGNVMAGTRVREAQLTKEIETLYIVLGEVIKNQEVAKFNLELTTPIFQVIDRPYYPLKVIEISKVLSVVVSCMVSVMGLILFLMVKNFLR